MQPDWRSLTPHRPLGVDDARYAPPPNEVARRLADTVVSGVATVLVGGPVGVGKSTELAHAAKLLQRERVACLVQLDRFENMRELTPERAQLRAAGRLAELARDALHLPISAPLRAALVQSGVLPQTHSETAEAEAVRASEAVLLRSIVDEVANASRQRRVTLLIDGLEKAGEGAKAVLQAFGALSESVDLVAVVPWQAVYGPLAEDVMRPGEKLVVMQAVPVEAEGDFEGRGFLVRILEARLGLRAHSLAADGLDDNILSFLAADHSIPAEFHALLRHAAELSGGLPRMFLQLVADAGTYARQTWGTDWPVVQPHLQEAGRDMEASFLRALLPGDTEALRLVDGTDGREMDLARKVRLLAHAILLERTEKGRTVMRPHPLVRPLLTPEPQAAP